MSTFYKIIQGVEYPIRVYATPAIMVIKGQNEILRFDAPSGQFLNVLIDQNNYLEGGVYQYQLFQDSDLKQFGSLQVIPSLLVNSTQQLRGKYAIIVEAIQKQLAGVATLAQRHVQVGDKTIDKYSADDLLKLLTYFKGKLAEQEAQNNINPKTDQLKIKYKWELR